MTALSKLTKEEALAELETLKEKVDYEDTTWDENTSVTELRQLVREGREALEDEEDEEESDSDGASEEVPAPVSDDVPPPSTPVDDYLQKYQVRIVQGIQIKGGKESDPEKDSKAERMKEHLLSQPRVRMMISRPDGESKSVEQSVTLNGYRLDLPKNTYLDLPQQIAEVIRQSQGQTEEAFAQAARDFGIDRVKDGQNVADQLT